MGKSLEGITMGVASASFQIEGGGTPTAKANPFGIAGSTRPATERPPAMWPRIITIFLRRI